MDKELRKWLINLGLALFLVVFVGSYALKEVTYECYYYNGSLKDYYERTFEEHAMLNFSTTNKSLVDREEWCDDDRYTMVGCHPRCDWVRIITPFSTKLVKYVPSNSFNCSSNMSLLDMNISDNYDFDLRWSW